MITRMMIAGGMVDGQIACKVKVNRNRSPQEALDATGRVQITDRKVVDSMPRGVGDNVEIVFFTLLPWEYTSPSYISDVGLEKVFERRGLKPADPISVAAVNEADPAFADKYSHGTHWKDIKGNWCFASFHRLYGDREVYVDRRDASWHASWWFAGVRLPV